MEPQSVHSSDWIKGIFSVTNERLWLTNEWFSHTEKTIICQQKLANANMLPMSWRGGSICRLDFEDETVLYNILTRGNKTFCSIVWKSLIKEAMKEQAELIV